MAHCAAVAGGLVSFGGDGGRGGEWITLLVVMGVVVVMMSVNLIFILSQDLLACYPPALAVFFGEQRLVVPFGGFGRVGHVRVAF